VARRADVVTATCRSCAAPILWAVTADRRSMPVNLEPDPDGNLDLLWVSPGMQPRVLVVDPAQPTLDDGPRYTSHFATCPNADQHRRNRT
jgi:hypothetical protein